MVETEVKLRVDSRREAAAMLRLAGFRLAHRRVFEVNLVLDTAATALRASGRLLRLRSAGGKVWLTFKGQSLGGRHKSREEVEITLSDFDAAMRIFSEMGYAPVFRYEKYRTEYFDPRRGGGLAMVDETPLGVFLELEGTGEWIDRRARQLGFTPADYVTLSYGALYFEHCRDHGLKPADMVFA